MLCDSTSHRLRSAKIEGWQIWKLIIPIDIPFNYYLRKNLTAIVNRSQDTRVQIVRNPGCNVTKLFLNQTSFYLSTRATYIIFYTFYTNVIISD